MHEIVGLLFLAGFLSTAACKGQQAVAPNETEPVAAGEAAAGQTAKARGKESDDTSSPRPSGAEAQEAARSLMKAIAASDANAFANHVVLPFVHDFDGECDNARPASNRAEVDQVSKCVFDTLLPLLVREEGDEPVSWKSATSAKDVDEMLRAKAAPLLETRGAAFVTAHVPSDSGAWECVFAVQWGPNGQPGVSSAVCASAAP